MTRQTGKQTWEDPLDFQVQNLLHVISLTKLHSFVYKGIDLKKIKNLGLKLLQGLPFSFLKSKRQILIDIFKYP